MDWQNLRFDWNQARAVLVTAEEGSLSAAARALGLTQPTVGRQVSALEETLGVNLFTRAGKRMELTQAGLHLIEHFRAMGTAANSAAMVAGGESQEVAGLVTITASDLYASEFLPAVIAGLRNEAPALQVQIVATNAVRDLIRREADIAIRHVRPDQPDLTGKLVGEDQGALYAAPELAARGPVETLPFIDFDLTDALQKVLAEKGLQVGPDQFVTLTEDSPTQRALCRAGVGVAVLPVWVGDADPDLVRLCPQRAPLISYPVWLAAHRDLHSARRVRLVFDRLAEALKTQLRLND